MASRARTTQFVERHVEYGGLGPMNRAGKAGAVHNDSCSYYD